MKLLLGCNFIREPINSTWHYMTWANTLPEDRLYLEKYREVTIIQPTWMIHRLRFMELGGYITSINNNIGTTYKLIHPIHDNKDTIRLAEDLRFFHAHLIHGGKLKLLPQPSLIYRYNNNTQSTQTTHNLLFQLRVKVFEDTILKNNWDKFVIWGAGRDGKLFLKCLSSSDMRQRVVCFVDVDEKKIKSRFYCNKELGVKIPILHFSCLSSSDQCSSVSPLVDTVGSVNGDFGNISKKQDGNAKEVFEKVRGILRNDNNQHNQNTNRLHQNKRVDPKINNTAIIPNKDSKKLNNKNKFHDRELHQLLPSLPVVVCVAMYRTNGVLESNVMSVGRTEGDNLWFFS